MSDDEEDNSSKLVRGMEDGDDEDDEEFLPGSGGSGSPGKKSPEKRSPGKKKVAGRRESRVGPLGSEERGRRGDEDDEEEEEDDDDAAYSDIDSDESQESGDDEDGEDGDDDNRSSQAGSDNSDNSPRRRSHLPTTKDPLTPNPLIRITRRPGLPAKSNSKRERIESIYGNDLEALKAGIMSRDLWITQCVLPHRKNLSYTKFFDPAAVEIDPQHKNAGPKQQRKTPIRQTHAREIE